MVGGNQNELVGGLLILIALVFAVTFACGDDDDDDDRGESFIEGGGASPGGGGGADAADDDDSGDECENDCYETQDCIEMARYTYDCGIIFEFDGKELTLEELEMLCAQGYDPLLGCAVYCWLDSLDANCDEYAECLVSNCA